MDPLIHTLKSLPSTVWWLVALAVVIQIFRTAWFKGMCGEWIVRFSAFLRLPASTYRALHNIMLHTNDGTSTQIDHIFVSRYGVFVVETKYMSGWIFGGEHQAQWRQTLYRRSFQFQNPLRQNYRHVKAVEALLELPPQHIHSVVTFTGNSEFKTQMPVNVTNGAEFITYIKSFRAPVLTEAEVDTAVARLRQGRVPSTRQTRRSHIEGLRERSSVARERSEME